MVMDSHSCPPELQAARKTNMQASVRAVFGESWQLPGSQRHQQLNGVSFVIAIGHKTNKSMAVYRLIRIYMILGYDSVKPRIMNCSGGKRVPIHMA